MPSPNIKAIDAADSIDVSIGVEKSNRADVAKHLNRFLASTFVLAMRTQYYHWNVTGPHFHSLHLMFEEQYKDLQSAGDELAERVRALGYKVPGRFQDFLALSDVKEDAGLPANAHTMIQNLLEANEICSRQSAEAINVTESLEDQVTNDLLIERKAYHDKAAWMLRSFLE